MDRAWVRRCLLGLLALVAANALAAGTALALRPDGGLLAMPPAWLEDAPFEDYRVPGLLLAGLGVLHAWAAWTQWRRHVGAWFWSGLAGGGLVVWIAVQTTMVPYFFLQPVLLAVGLAEGLLSLAQAPWFPRPHQ